MAQPVLEYATPQHVPPSAWRRNAVVVAWFALGAVPTVTFIGVYHGTFGGFVLGLPLCLFAATAEALIGTMEMRDRTRSIVFALMVWVLCFPAAHGALCRVFGVLKNDPLFPIHVTGLHFVPMWIVVGVGFAAAAWKPLHFGARAVDWMFAGVATPVLIMATGMGLIALNQSITAQSVASMPFDIFGVILAVIVPYAFIAVTFVPLESKPMPVATRLIEQQTSEAARHLEAIASSPDRVELR